MKQCCWKPLTVSATPAIRAATSSTVLGSQHRTYPQRLRGLLILQSHVTGSEHDESLRTQES